MDIRELLEKVRGGKLEIDAAEKYLRSHSGVRAYEEMGYAKLDTDRKRRSGFAEVIYCQGKSDEFLPEIFRKLYEAEGEVFGTRADAHQYEIVRAVLPDISYDPVSRILKLEKKDKEHTGLVAVCTGGTADIPVAEEAAQTAEYFGSRVERIYDVGVSGIHRLLSCEKKVREANCVIAGYGRCSCVGDWRACGQSRHCRAHFCGVWRELSWAVGSFDDDQFLRERHCDGKYR